VPGLKVTDGTGATVDFFISYAPADQEWAEWIGWTLEESGYHIMMQAWDFVGGADFVQLMHRGVEEAARMIAVLSPAYLQSVYGRLEWQAVYRSDPTGLNRRLLPIRVVPCEPTGLLAAITYVDMVGVPDEDTAADRLDHAVRGAVQGRAKPEVKPSFPGVPGQPGPYGAPGHGAPIARQQQRAIEGRPQFPRALPAGEDAAETAELTVLHLADLGVLFAEPESGGAEAADPVAGLVADIGAATADAGARPDLIVVSGGLTAGARPSEFDRAGELLANLAGTFGLGRHRVVMVPGGRDVSVSACRAYFANCEADEVEPAPPYWPKWRHYARMFGEFYRDAEKVRFEADMPWTLVEIPELRVAVAGLNSTIAMSHLSGEDGGWIGTEQASWFAERLAPYEERGWLRVGAVHHDVTGSGDGVADAGRLAGTVAPRLNVLLQGSAGADTLDGAPDGPRVLATGSDPDGPRYELLRLNRDGITRWERRRTDGTTWEAGPTAAPIALTWKSAQTTFPAPGETASKRRPATGVVAAAAARRDDPTSLLLTRLAEICELRYPDATVRRYDGDPPYLLLTHGEERFFQQLRIAACPGDPTREALDAFVSRVHAIDPEPGSQLVYSGAQPDQALVDEAMRRGVRLRSFAEFRGLLDLRRYVAAQTEALTHDRRYTPGLYVPQRYRDLDRTGGIAEGEDLFADVLRMLGDDQGHFLLLLGDFGRGKTFLMRELARRLPVELPHLTPMLIELRTLETVASLDELIAAHLAASGVERFDLAAFKYMLRTGQLVLLFDGFDEMAVRPTYDRAAERLATLMRAAEGQAKIVVSSRAGSLLSDDQARDALARVEPIPGRRLLEVRDFTETQMRAFLVNSYDGDEARADARLDLIRGVKDLLGLASNPRMLAFIADLDDDRLHDAQSADGEVGAANLYRQILDAWLAYEAEVRGGPAARAANLDKARRWEAVMALALRLWDSDRPYVTLADLTDVAGDVIAGLTERRLTAEQAAHVVGSGTLLVRAGEGAFTFVHNSVMEWLVAAEIAQRLGRGETDPEPLRGRVISALMADFLVDLAGYRQCRAWAERTLADSKAAEAARANALKISGRVREPTGVPVNLRGVNFRGVDLSGRDLRRADLSGADLTDARLVGTDLEGARLIGTKLAGARLDRARMLRADLSGADLTGARLLGTDLRETVTAGATWRRATLVAVEGQAELAASDGLAGAAVVPGTDVETELAPATVGIAHSFRNGALPGLLAFSPDGGVLAVGDETGAVVICDAYHGAGLRTLTGHSDRVYTLAFNPSGDRLVTAGLDEEVRLWDPMTGECVQLLGGHATPVWSVQFSPDGTQLVTADADGVVREWDPTTGECRRTHDDHEGSVWSVRFAPDGSTLVTAGDDHAVPVYDTRTGEHLRTLRGHAAPIWWAHFNGDGSLLATCDAQGEVRLSSVETGHCLRTLRGHHGPVWSAAFSPDGALIATAGDDHTVRVFETETGECLHVLEGHTGPVWVAVFSPDGARLVTASSDHDLRVWDPRGGEPLRTLRGHTGPVWACAFSADGSLLASTSNDDTVLIWDPATGARRDKLAGHIERLSSVVYHPEGRLLLSTSNDGRAHLWDPATGAYRHALPGHTGRIGSAEFTPDGALVAIPGNLGDVRMWDVETGRHHHSLGADTDQVWAVAFSPNGRMLATATDDDSVRLWTVNTDRLIRTLAGHTGRVRSLSFSADGSTLASACDDRTVRLWNPATGRCRHVLDGHGDRVWQVAFSPDGSLLASASYDATVRLWDPVTGRPTRALLGHAGRVRSVAFSPDGRLLATSGDDRTVRLWDVAAGGELWTLRDYTDPARSVAFSPDGAQLATASDDGAVRLWDIRDGAPVSRVMLIGLPDGWAAASRDGRYKLSGDPAGKFWHVVGLCRFEPGELDPYVPDIRRLDDDAHF
jgi:WD40 repeat protein